MSIPSHITNIYELLDQDGEPSSAVKFTAAKETKAPVKSSASTKAPVKAAQQTSNAGKTGSQRGDTRRDRGDRKPGQGQSGEPRRDRLGAVVEGGETSTQPVETARRDRPRDRDNAREKGESRGDDRRRREKQVGTGNFVGNRRFNDRKSGTGRPMNEEKKGGRGLGNWGSNDGSEEVTAIEESAKDAVTEQVQEEKPVKEETPEEKEKREKAEEEAAKEAKQRTLGDYFKEREEKRLKLAALSKAPEVRKANEGTDEKQQKQWSALQQYKRDGEEETATKVHSEEKEEKKDKKSKNTVRLDEVFTIKEQPRPRNEDGERRGGRGGRGRGGRGGSRGGSGRGSSERRGSSNPGPVDFNSQDPLSFPTLH